MTSTKQTHHSIDQNLPLPPHFKAQDDEIDLRELFKALWEGKFIIILTTVLFAIGAVGYALKSQEWWSSEGEITKPQSRSFEQYQMQVKQFQPVFDVYQGDGTVLVSESLDDLIDDEYLFMEFITAFNSTVNKRTFLDSNTAFQEFKSLLEAEAEAEADTDTDEATRRFYESWFSRLTAVSTVKGENDIFNVSVQATTKSDSYKMLNDYILYISNVVHQGLLLNLQAIITSKKNELLQQRSALILQAKQNLEVEIKRAQYALQIAKAANVNQPIQNLGNTEVFAINLGSSAIEAKIEALKSVENLSVIEPRIQQLESKLTLIQSTQINRNIKFQTYRYLAEPQIPLNRDAPKRTLIVVLGALLGGVLGVAIVLVRFAFRKEDKAESV